MDLAKRLHAEDGMSRPQKFSIFITDRDAANKPIKDIGRWIDEATSLMTEINGGCTRLPIAKGAWVNRQSGEMIVEDTVVIYSYLLDPEQFDERFDEIVEFLHAYGVETKQDAVMAEFSGWSNDEDGYICEAYTIPSENYLSPEV
jgi:hypothetical protein